MKSSFRTLTKPITNKLIQLSVDFSRQPTPHPRSHIATPVTIPHAAALSRCRVSNDAEFPIKQLNASIDGVSLEIASVAQRSVEAEDQGAVDGGVALFLDRGVRARADSTAGAAGVSVRSGQLGEVSVEAHDALFAQGDEFGFFVG